MNRVRQGMRAQADHTDDWLITYADMITLLLCFFVVFFIVSSSRKNGQQEAPAAGEAAQMTQITPAPKLPHLVQHELTLHDFDEFVHPMVNIADEVATRIGKPSHWTHVIAPPVIAAVAPAQSSAEATAASIDTNPAKIVGNPGLDGTPDIEPQSDRITTLEMSSSAFFGSGSARLSDGGKSILRDLAVDLQSGRYEAYRIAVEGHTDDAPIATRQFSSNWALSTARAVAVVHFFIDQGIPAQKLRAAGYADTYPKLPNRDAHGNAIPENQAQNRRVVIRLEKIEKSG
jgi:flagellar motor protein MotB